MANTIIGRIHSIGQTVNVSKKENTFNKRELVLNASRYDPISGVERKNIVSFSFVQNNCQKLDAFKPGDFVEVSFVLQGREYDKDGIIKYITDIVGYDIAPYQVNMQPQQAAAPQAQVQAAQAPVPQPQVPQAPVQPQQAFAPQGQQHVQVQQPQQGSAPQQFIPQGQWQGNDGNGQLPF